MDVNEFEPIASGPVSSAIKNAANDLLKDWRIERQAERMGHPQDDFGSAFIRSVLLQVNILNDDIESETFKSSAFWKKVLWPFIACVKPIQERRHEKIKDTLRKDIEDGQRIVSFSQSKALKEKLTQIHQGEILIPFDRNWTSKDDTKNQKPLNSITHVESRETLINATGELLRDLDTLDNIVNSTLKENLTRITQQLGGIVLQIARHFFLNPEEVDLLVILTQTWTAATKVGEVLNIANPSDCRLLVKPLESSIEMIDRNFQDWKSEHPVRNRTSTADNNGYETEPDVIGDPVDVITNESLESERLAAIVEVEHNLREFYDIPEHLSVKRLIEILENKLNLVVHHMDLSGVEYCISNQGGFGTIYPHPTDSKLCLKEVIDREWNHRQFGAKLRGDEYNPNTGDLSEFSKKWVSRTCMRILREARNWDIALQGSNFQIGLIAPLLGIVVDTSSSGKHPYPSFLTVFRVEKSLAEYNIAEKPDTNTKIHMLIQVGNALSFRKKDRRMSLPRQLIASTVHDRPEVVVHGDLKASNILVVREEGKPRIQLIDFGSARVFDGAHGLSTQNSHGTPRTKGFLAPEAFKGKYGPSCDVFAFGSLFIQVMYGELDTKVRTFSQKGAVFQKCLKEFSFDSEQHREFVEECWNSKPERRPKAKDLEKLLRKMLVAL